MPKSPSLTYKASILLIANAIRSLANIAIYMVLSRLLSQEEYGTYRQIWLLITILSQLAVFGLPASISYFISGRNKKEQSTYLLQALLIILITSIGQVTLLWLLSNKIALLFNNSHLSSVLILSLPIFLIYPYTHVISPTLVAKGRYVAAALLNVLYSLITVGGIIISALILPTAINVIVALTIAVMAYVFIAMLTSISSFSWDKLDISKSRITEQTQYAIPLGLALSVELFSKFTDKIIVSNAVSTNEFSIYMNGAFEIPFVSMISGAALAILFPEFVKLFKSDKKPTIVGHLNESINKTSLILLPIMFFFLLFAREIIVAMYTDRYEDSTIIFTLYLLILPLRVTILSQVLSSFNKNKVVLQAIGAGLAINIIITYPLVHLYGMVGAPIGTLVSLYSINGFMLFKVVRELSTKLTKLLPFKQILQLSLLSLSTAILAKIVVPAHLHNLLYLAIVGSIYLGIHAVVFYYHKQKRGEVVV